MPLASASGLRDCVAAQTMPLNAGLNSRGCRTPGSSVRGRNRTVLLSNASGLRGCVAALTMPLDAGSRSSCLPAPGASVRERSGTVPLSGDADDP